LIEVHSVSEGKKERKNEKKIEKKEKA